MHLQTLMPADAGPQDASPGDDAANSRHVRDCSTR